MKNRTILITSSMVLLMAIFQSNVCYNTYKIADTFTSAVPLSRSGNGGAFGRCAEYNGTQPIVGRDITSVDVLRNPGCINQATAVCQAIHSSMYRSGYWDGGTLTCYYNTYIG